MLNDDQRIDFNGLSTSVQWIIKERGTMSNSQSRGIRQFVQPHTNSAPPTFQDQEGILVNQALV